MDTRDKGAGFGVPGLNEFIGEEFPLLSQGGCVYLSQRADIKSWSLCHSLWEASGICRRIPNYLVLSLSAGNLLDTERFLCCLSVTGQGLLLCCPGCIRREYVGEEISQTNGGDTVVWTVGLAEARCVAV